MAEKEFKGIGDVATVNDVVKEMVDISIREGTPVSQSDARRAFNLVRDAMYELLKKGTKVQLTGFAVFSPIYKPARTVFNIATKSPMDTKECVAISVKLGKKIKEIAAGYDENVLRIFKDEFLSEKAKAQARNK